MTIQVDIQGLQNAQSGERGVPRYIYEYARSLEARHPGLVSAWNLNPHLPIPPTVEPLLGAAHLRRSETFAGPPPAVYHIASPFELSISMRRLWPNAARGPRTRLAVTVYDLIPLLYPDPYLQDPGTRLRYQARLELVRSADLIMTISEATARDVIAHLGTTPDRVVSVGTGVSTRFQPPVDNRATLESLRRRLPDLRPGFILYTGGIDHRKNMLGLLSAYAQLPEETRTQHQLVIVCRVSDSERATLEAELRSLGIARDVLLTGFVADDVLLMLYQTTHLFVFPSLYEGFGLPVAEAMACGAAVVAGDNSSLVDLVPLEWARFRSESPAAIATTLRLVLTEEPERIGQLRSASSATSFSWDTVADVAASCYQDLLCRGPRSPRPRPAVAYVSPLPPAETGIADYSAQLLKHLNTHCTVYTFSPDGKAERTADGEEPLALASMDQVEPIIGGFDRVIYALGNSEHHCATLLALRRRPGVVIAHDVRLVNIYLWARRLGLDLPPSYAEMLDRIEAQELPETLHGYRSFGPPEYYRLNHLMLGEVLECCERLFTHSPFAAAMAALDNPSELTHKVDHIPFALPERQALPIVRKATERLMVSSFGIIAQAKQSDKLVEAFIIAAGFAPTYEFSLVGHVNEADRERYNDWAREANVRERIHIHGRVSADSYDKALRSTDIAVQLRDISNGETSAAMGDCLAAGIPLIATEMGSAATLPRQVMLAVDRLISANDLAITILALADDHERRLSMHEAALRYSKDHSFAAVAEDIMQRIVLDTEKKLEEVHLREDRPTGSAGPRYQGPGKVRVGGR